MRNSLLFNLIFFIFSISLAQAKLTDGFLLKPGLTLEYQAPNINAKALNDHFETEPFEKQLKSIDNIVLGLNFRVHKYLGFNANWSQFALENQYANGHGLLLQKSDLAVENINFSSLFYFPIIGDDVLDGFIEAGFSDVNYDFRMVDATGAVYSFKDHETAPLYGAGVEWTPYNKDLAFRLSVQRYTTKLTPINGDIVTWRGGLVKSF